MDDFIDIKIRQQDGSTVRLKYRDTTHNRRLRDYIAKMEGFAKIERGEDNETT